MKRSCIRNAQRSLLGHPFPSPPTEAGDCRRPPAFLNMPTKSTGSPAYEAADAGRMRQARFRRFLNKKRRGRSRLAEPPPFFLSSYCEHRLKRLTFLRRLSAGRLLGSSPRVCSRITNRRLPNNVEGCAFGEPGGFAASRIRARQLEARHFCVRRAACQPTSRKVSPNASTRSYYRRCRRGSKSCGAFQTPGAGLHGFDDRPVQNDFLWKLWYSLLCGWRCLGCVGIESHQLSYGPRQ